MARLKETYKSKIINKLMKELNYKNINQVPKLIKIVINMGVGEATQNIKVLDQAVEDLAAITGQKPVITRSKKSISNFKLRGNIPIGCKVTLRGKMMYEFLDRFINIALPRIRDFKGVSGKSFDGRGNYNIGIKEQFIFPEIEYDKVEMVHGLDITICTTAKTDKESKALLSYFGMPFRN